MKSMVIVVAARAVLAEAANNAPIIASETPEIQLRLHRDFERTSDAGVKMKP